MEKKKNKKETVPYKDSNIYNKSKIPFHFNYTMRMSFVLISFIFIALILSSFADRISILYKESKFKIEENGYITYDVSLLNNEFYTDEVLGMDMAYVPNLIDKINLKFNYNFNSEEYLEIDFEDTIKYDFIVLNNSDNKVLYDTSLYEIERHTLFREKALRYNDSVEIDYQKYKRKYDELVLLYGKDITGYINVSNTISKTSDLDLIKDYTKADNVFSVKIPVINDTFSINLEDEARFRNKNIITKDNVAQSANRLIVITIIVLCCLFALVFMTFVKLLLMLRTKQSKYDKLVNKILREYDNIIVETMVYPKTEGLNKISVNSFKEILDTHDLLHKPILYYNVVSHMKCIFYILDNNDLYVYTIKEVDLEN